MKKKRFLAGLLAAAMCLGGMPAFSAHAAEGAQDSSSVVAEVDSHYSVIIPKSLQMAVDTATWHGTAGYQASVVGDIEPGKSVYVVPQARFDMVQADGGAIVDTSVSQTKTEWPSADVKAEEADAIWGDGSLSGDGFQPGDWSGVFYFNIAADDSGLNVEAPGDKIVEADLSGGDVAEAGTFQLGQGQSGSIQLVHDGVDVTRKAMYESDNERITVDENGKVGTENAAGGDEATITATYFLPTASAAEGGSANAVKAYFKVQVIGIAFDKETVTVRPGDSVTVTAEVLPGSVDGTVKWMLNGLDFGAEGNTITINVAEDAQPGNYTLVAMYGGTSQTLNIKVANGPSASGIVDGGEYTGSVSVTVGEGNTVTVDGKDVALDGDGSFTIDTDGKHVIVVTGADGSSVTYNITILHECKYVDGFCSGCGQKDPDYVIPEHVHDYTMGKCSVCRERVPGVYSSVSKRMVYDYITLQDAGFDPSMSYGDSVTRPNYWYENNCQYIMSNVAGTRTGTYILVISDDVTSIGSNAFKCSNNSGSVEMFSMIDLPDTITSIGTGAFQYTTKISSMFIPDSIVNVGVESVHVQGGNSVDWSGPWEDTDIVVYCEKSLDDMPEHWNWDYDYGEGDSRGIKKITSHHGYTRSDYHCRQKGTHFVIWNESKAATCTDEGEKIGTCDSCGHFEISPIPALGHSFPARPTDDQVVIKKEPTCTETGIKCKICTVCGELSKELSIPKISHAYVDVETIDATCESDGYYLRRCSFCNDESHIKMANALGHDYDYRSGACRRCGVNRESADDSIIYDGTHVTGYRDNGYYPVIRIKEGTTHIDEKALKNIKCGKIILPDSIEHLGKYSIQSLYVCEVVVPSSITTVVDNAFWNVATVTYSGSLDTSKWGCWSVNGYYDEEGGFVFDSSDKSYLLRASLNTDGVVIIPDSVREIRSSAIAQSDIEYVIINPGCVKINKQLLYNIASLKGLWIPSSVTDVPSSGAPSAGNSLIGYCNNVTVYCEAAAVPFPSGWNLISGPSKYAPVEFNVSMDDFLKLTK